MAVGVHVQCGDKKVRQQLGGGGVLLVSDSSDADCPCPVRVTLPLYLGGGGGDVECQRSTRRGRTASNGDEG